jgi:hypothetical protein
LEVKLSHLSRRYLDHLLDGVDATDAEIARLIDTVIRLAAQERGMRREQREYWIAQQQAEAATQPRLRLLPMSRKD